MREGYGLDISLTHGALVYGEWDTDRRVHTLKEYAVLYQWDKEDDVSLSEKSTLTDVRLFCLQVFDTLKDKEYTRLPIAVDWDPTVVFWGRRSSAVTLAFLVGYLSHTLEILGYPVVYITPAELREKLTSSRKSVTKGKIWSMFPDLKKRVKGDSDVKDALVLSYLVARSNDGPKQTSTARVPGRKARKRNTHNTQKPKKVPTTS